MKERPILFNGPEVRAILEGRKTQARRIIKNHPLIDGRFTDEFIRMPENHVADDCPYGNPGDRLWVRETFAPLTNGYAYRADGIYNKSPSGKWMPSTRMPRRASRLTLEVTGVRVERLQDISEEDAKAEGVLEGTGDFAGCFSCGTALSGTTARECYSRLWAGSWDNNPWVWCISFKRVEA